MIKLKDILNEKNPGLWANIHAKRKRGEKPAKPGDEDYPETLDIDEDEDPCWDDYKQVGMKTKNGKMYLCYRYRNKLSYYETETNLE